MLLGGLLWFVFVAAVASVLSIVLGILVTHHAGFVVLAPAAVIQREAVIRERGAAPGLRAVTRFAFGAEFAPMHHGFSMATDAACRSADKLRSLVTAHTSYLRMRARQRKFRFIVIKTD